MTEYRSHERQYTNSTEYPIAGDWELYDTVKNWGDWSSWRDTPIAAIPGSRNVETRQVLVTPAYKEYRYQRWYSNNCSKGVWSHFCKICAINLYGGTWTLQYSPWSTTKYAVSSTQYCSHEGYVDIVKIDGRSYYQRHERTIAATYKTQYRYQDAYNVYYYQRWSDWSDWSEDYIGSSSTVEVETREKYRYRTTVDPAGEDSSGQLYEINGTLDLLEKDYSGMYAAIMVYQGSNADPTQTQLQYAGGTTIGDNNSYSFTFKTKTTISQDTGDFIITLGIEGATNLLNVDRIEAPVAQYTVAFLDYDGSLIEEQIVNEGLSAMLPQAPTRDGYLFSKWDKSFTNVTGNMTVTALYSPLEHAVVYVDWQQNTIEMTTQFHGELLAPPENPTVEGHLFIGWDAILNGDTVVLGNMVVSAQYQPYVYSVTFLNEDGGIYEVQQVEHGESAVLPADLTVADDKIFLGWDNESEWWNVTDDITVLPIVVFEENTMTPISTFGDFYCGTSNFINLSSEDGAIIYFTTDYTDPTNESEIYTEPIYIDETTVIKAVALKDGKNYSELVQVVFVYDDTNLPTDLDAISELKTNNAIVKPNRNVKIEVDISNNPGLSNYLFFVECDTSLFYIDFDPYTGEPNYQAGNVSENGTMLVWPWEDKGWQILWFNDQPTTHDGPLFTLHLTASENISAGRYPFKIYYSSANILNENFEEMPLPETSVKILPMVIDSNTDGNIDLLDIAATAQHYGSDYDDCDFNIDGIVNLFDLVLTAIFIE